MTGSRRFSTPAGRMLALAAAVTGMTVAVAGSSIAATRPSATLVANKHVAGLYAHSLSGGTLLHLIGADAVLPRQRRLALPPGHVQ